LNKLGFAAGSVAYRAVFAAIASLSNANDLPAAADVETSFSPGRAYVRRVAGHNVWLLYRFDDHRLFVMTARGEPPLPADD
jgi:hypothetical protein